MRAVHLLIHGRVQGVGYRANTERAARKLGLTGWVRNRVDGAVEAHAQGDEQQVAALVSWCHRGPPSARVDNVQVTDVQVDPSFTDFLVRPTI
ncbi:MAG: acylphosphatase [Myxococcota bacterium]